MRTSARLIDPILPHAQAKLQPLPLLTVPFVMIPPRTSSTWFLVDLVSVLTGVVDILMVTPMAQGEGTGALEQLRILRVLRVLRLVKLVRLLKTSRLLKRWQSAIALDFSTQTLLSCLITYLVAGHWFACILVLTTTVADSPYLTWLTPKGYCERAASPDDLRYGASWVLQDIPLNPEMAHLDDVYCVSSFQLWVGTYYWMMQLISGSAGGDTNQKDLMTHEQLVFTLLVIFSCLLSSQIVASFCDIVSNLNPENAVFRNRMDHLNRYCREKKLGVMVRRELREYLLRTKNVQVGESQRELMQLMSPKLQGELSLQINGPWLTMVPFLRKVETGCSVAIAMSLRPRVYVPTEMLPADCMYMLGSGMVVTRGRVISGGTMWGADCIMCRHDLRSRPARALTYVEVDYIHRDILLEIVHSVSFRTRPDGSELPVLEYPVAVRRMRWHTVMLGMIREYQRLKHQLHLHSKDASPAALRSAWTFSLQNMDGGDVHMDGSTTMTDNTARSMMSFQRQQPTLGMLWKPPVDVQLWA